MIKKRIHMYIKGRGDFCFLSADIKISISEGEQSFLLVGGDSRF